MTQQPVSLLHVHLDFGTSALKLGRLALVKRQIYFEYDPAFLETGIQISPLKLPLKIGAVACNDAVFEGLFGVFNDSLPDGWGRLLVDRKARKIGIAPELLNPLDRLAHVGRFGMGALTYKPEFPAHLEPEAISLDRLAAETAQVLAGQAEDVFAELQQLSGSSAGARPKVMLGVSADRQRLTHGQQELPAGYTHWMVKFASASDANDIGAIEYAYSLMARAAGLEVEPAHLFPARHGAGYFGVMRFDRDCSRRLHMHTISGLLHADHRLPSLDYEQIMRSVLLLTRSVHELEKILRLASFNVFAHNRDDHAKNFSLLMDEHGYWRTSPPYDLTFSTGPGGEHSTTIMGEGRSPGKTHLLALAEKTGLTAARAGEIIAHVEDAVHNWPGHAQQAGVSKMSRKLVADAIGI